MRSQPHNGRAAKVVPAILAAALAFFWAPPPASGQVRLQRVADNILEITGGSGSRAWRMRYGTDTPRPEIVPQMVEAGNGRAWFSHGMWLRQIDTAKGVVVGRWRLPGNILVLTPEGSKVRVELEDPESQQIRYRQTLVFDPAAPNLPERCVDRMTLYHYPILEAQWPLRPRPGTFAQLSAVEAKALVPQMEEAIRRDPLSPWLRIMLAHLLQTSGEARFRDVLVEAVRLPNLDFSELFRMSGHLDALAQTELGSEAFERGYKDFLARGYDPRVFSVLIFRLVLYPVKWERLTPEHREKVIERIYRLTPAGETASLAWQFHIQELERKGQAEAARAWRVRAEQAGTSGLSFQDLGFPADRAMLVLGASVLAMFAYIVLLYLRYWPQRRLDKAAAKRKGFGLFSLDYWDRRERLGFFFIVLAGWVAIGVTAGFTAGILRIASSPISLFSGNFAGPKNIHRFEILPATPERDLHLALVYQQSGDLQQAEALYRKLPEFAESWNNLGVLLKEAGKEQEARQAFEQALRVDPALPEAALNLGQGPKDFWTGQYQKLLPGRPMLAPPRAQRSVRALQGGSRASVYAHSLAGPFVGAFRFGDLFSEPEARIPDVVRWIATPFLALAIALLFLIPSREVTQAPGERYWLWEVLFPGLSPRWSFCGVLVFLAWICLLLQLVLQMWWGSPYLITAMSLPNLSRAYGVAVDFRDLLALVNPGWIWLYGAPAVLFLANLGLVLLGRRR